MSRIFRHDPVNFDALPPVIKALMGAQVLGFLVSWVVGPQINDLFGLVPRHVLVDRWVWQPFTYLFLHGGFWHLLFNLFALWMFGMPVESQWGGREFVKYFFLCGLGAAFFTVLLSPGSPTPTIGSSGSVYGLIVAFALLYPDAVVYLYFLIPVRAIHMAIIFAALEFFSGLSGSKPGIANWSCTSAACSSATRRTQTSCRLHVARAGAGCSSATRLRRPGAPRRAARPPSGRPRRRPPRTAWPRWTASSTRSSPAAWSR